VERAVDEFRVKEKELLDGALRGAVDSFGGLVEMYQERAIRIAASFVGMSDARDLAQEAFIKAWENLGRFKGESRFYTWFYRILVNTCKDFLRKKKTRQVFSFWFSREEEEGLDPSASVMDLSKNASEQLLNRELGASIAQALEMLPGRQKSVFVLRYLEGMSLSEISDTLSISLGAVKAHLWQAGQKMKALLRNENDYAE